MLQPDEGRYLPGLGSRLALDRPLRDSQTIHFALANEKQNTHLRNEK